MRFRLVSLLLAATTFGAVNSVSAADLPARAPAPVYKAPAVVAAPVETWTGFYVGIIGGYSSGHTSNNPTGFIAPPTGVPTSFTVDGAFVGGQIGYDRQFNNFVLGVVADGAWANLKGKTCAEATSGGCSGGTPDDSYAIGKVDWLATVRGKAGVTFTPQTLVYVTGGAAFAGTSAEVTFIDGTNSVKKNETRSGYAVGVGGQYKITRNVSFGLEYLYADFGTKTIAFDPSATALAGQVVTADSKLHLNIFKAALNLHF